MDLGCLDLGCIDKETHDPGSNEAERSRVDSTSPTLTVNSKIGKSKMMKETGQSTNALNKFTSLIKKPSHRKNSPLNWFPRKKVDSYLERKIKSLQEVDGISLSLDETLGDANPHYCRVLREKIAVREAAHKAMEARKAALVEASWCRILRAARIQRKEAEIQLEKAEKAAAEAFEEATAVGVIMNDKPNCPRKPSQIEMSSAKGGLTHTVTASFETAFEVDREVAAAVKTALIRVASCSSFNKDEFKDLLQKISQNPDFEDIGNREVAELSSDCDSESGLDHKNDPAKPVDRIKQRKYKRRLSLEKLTMEKIADMMVERLKCLQEDELSSLATIVATCGLNAALAEVESSKIHDPRRVSSCSAAPELPSLDKFLVKHETKLEREVREAKNSKRDEARYKVKEISDEHGDRNVSMELPSLEHFLVKHVSKLEREVQEAKTDKGDEARGEESASVETGDGNLSSNIEKKTSAGNVFFSESVPEIPSLDKILVKHVSKLEQEVIEARNKRKNDPLEAGKSKRQISSGKFVEKENMNLNGNGKEDSLDKILVKPVSRLEREKVQALSAGSNYEYQKSQKKQTGDNLPSWESLDKILVKPVSRLEREKMQAFSSGSNYEYQKSQKKQYGDDTPSYESLDKVLVKPVSKLEREKMQALSSGSNYEYKKNQKQVGDIVPNCESLDQVLVKHVSGLEREKMNLSSRTEFLPREKRTEADAKSQIDVTDGLEQILVKHRPRLGREKMEASSQPTEQVSLSVSRKEAREKELQDSWGGLSLGNSMKPRLSKL